MLLKRSTFHLSIWHRHRSGGCSGGHCGGQWHSASGWPRGPSTGHDEARSPRCLARMLPREGQIRPSHSPNPGTPHQPPLGPSHGRKPSPTGCGEVPRLSLSTRCLHPIALYEVHLLWLKCAVNKTQAVGKNMRNYGLFFSPQIVSNSYQKPQLHSAEHANCLWGSIQWLKHEN